MSYIELSPAVPGAAGPQGPAGPTGPTGATGPAGPAGAPGGATTQIQYNNAGAFGGSANLTWNNTTSVATITGQLTVVLGTATSISAAGIVEASSFRGPGVAAYLAPASAGSIFLRPNGMVSAGNQLQISTTAVTTNNPVVLPADPTTALQATTKQYVDARTNTNLIINGNFRINQGGYVSAAVLAAGAYGHDQWKAGAAGGNYTFTQLVGNTQITIAAGKTLIQPIEDVMVVGGSYVLSWTGTAQARYGVNTLTPAGAYAASPVLIAGQTAGTVMSVEFNAGTLGTVKLESGSIATPFIMRPYDQELVTCKRYFQKYTAFYQVPSVGSMIASYPFPVVMRSTPAALILGGGTYSSATASVNSVTGDVVNFQTITTAANGFANFAFTADARL